MNLIHKSQRHARGFLYQMADSIDQKCSGAGVEHKRGKIAFFWCLHPLNIHIFHQGLKKLYLKSYQGHI